MRSTLTRTGVGLQRPSALGPNLICGNSLGGARLRGVSGTELLPAERMAIVAEMVMMRSGHTHAEGVGG